VRPAEPVPRVEEGRDVGSGSPDTPDADDRAERDPAPDPESTLPDGEWSPPVVEGAAGGGREVVQASSDNAGRKAPQRDVVHEFARASPRDPAPTCDRDSRDDGGGVAQSVDVDGERSEVKDVRGR
jgi:hypothetical protein